MTGAQTLARAGLVVTAAFLISRVLGWVRLIVIGATYGPAERDVFVAAFRIPDLIFQLVAAGALSSALIPIVAGLLTHGEEGRAWRVASTVGNVILAILLALALVVFGLAPVLVPSFTQGFGPVEQEKTVELTRIMLASPILLALGSLATSLLNATGRFTAAAIAPIAYNLAIIGGAVILAPAFGVVGLAISVVAGSACHIGVQLVPLRRIGFRYSARIDVGDEAARESLVLLVPRAIGLSASQLTFFVATSLATTLGVGAVSAFYFAFSVFQIPIGVIGIPIGVVMLPSLSRDLASGDVGRYVSLVTRALRLIVWVMLPLAGLTIVLRTQIVAFLFQSDKFGTRDIDLTATVLVFLALGLASESMIAILARAFYAGRDTLTPVVAAGLAVVVNVSMAIALVGPMGLAGIGLAIALGSWAEVGLLVVVLQRRIDAFESGDVLRAGALALGSALVATVAAFAVTAAIDQRIGPNPGRVLLAVEIAAATGAAGLVYVLISRALRIPELPTIVRLMSDALRRPARP